MRAPKLAGAKLAEPIRERLKLPMSTSARYPLRWALRQSAVLCALAMMCLGAVR
jgi:hypothetical protein